VSTPKEPLEASRRLKFDNHALRKALKDVDLPPDLAEPIERAFSRYMESRDHRVRELIAELHTWANNHIHGA
jgi:hypothetical protein